MPRDILTQVFDLDLVEKGEILKQVCFHPAHREHWPNTSTLCDSEIRCWHCQAAIFSCNSVYFFPFLWFKTKLYQAAAASKLRGSVPLRRDYFIYSRKLPTTIAAYGFTWKPQIPSFKWGMKISGTLTNGCVTGQNVEVTCLTSGQLKNMLKNSYLFEKMQNFFYQQIAQISLFQTRYESLLNSKKWPSDSS